MTSMAYSARCSSGTAQSSMKEIGFRCPAIDITMFSPAFLTFQIAACSSDVIALVTDEGYPISVMRPSKCPSSLSNSAPGSGEENSTSRSAPGVPRTNLAMVDRKSGIPAASVRTLESTSSTAEGPSETKCWTESNAWMRSGKWHRPRTRFLGSSASPSLSFEKKASVPSDPTRSLASASAPGPMRFRLYPATLRIVRGCRLRISSSLLL